MIGDFARLMRGPPRVVEPEEASNDAPPERFTQKISDEGGDVYVAPMLEALRAALAKAVKRQGAGEPSRPGKDASSHAPEGATSDPSAEGRP